MKTTFFIHIPKAAGRSFIRIMDSVYSPEEHMAIKDKSRISQYITAPSEQKNNIKLVSGHMHYGLHEHAGIDYDYIAIFREPVARLASHYHYVLRHPNHYLYEEVASNNMSFKDYCMSDLSTELDNGQVRLLISESKQPQINHVNNTHLEEAISNIENNFIAVGITERFEESMALFKKMLKWKNTFIRMSHHNKGSYNRNKLDVSDKEISIIKERNKYDFELYRFAEEMFERSVKENRSYIKIEMLKMKAFSNMSQIKNGFVNNQKEDQ